MIRIETERLVLRDHIVEDLDTHFKLMSDDETMRFLQDIKLHTVEEAKENLEQSMLAINESPRLTYYLRIVNKETNEHIGEIGYDVINEDENEKRVHLGYFSYPKHHNKGYMTEALLGLMQYAFINDNVTCIETGCLAINKASERVMIKCGFTKTNELEQYELFEGKYETRVEYCITREEYLREI